MPGLEPTTGRQSSRQSAGQCVRANTGGNRQAGRRRLNMCCICSKPTVSSPTTEAAGTWSRQAHRACKLPPPDTCGRSSGMCMGRWLSPHQNKLLACMESSADGGGLEQTNRGAQAQRDQQRPTCLTAARHLLATPASPCSLLHCLNIMHSVLATAGHSSNANKENGAGIQLVGSCSLQFLLYVAISQAVSLHAVSAYQSLLPLHPNHSRTAMNVARGA